MVSLTAALLLAACATGLPKPQVVPQLQADGGWFQLEQRDAEGHVVQSSLLAVEQSAGEMRFVQTDALGAPLSRQVVGKKGWRNDGFVMPNAVARRLFSAMLPLLAVDSSKVYPELERKSESGGECYFQRGEALWCAEKADKGWLIRFPDQTQWSVLPIQE